MINLLLIAKPWTPPKSFNLFGREVAFYGVIIAIAILVAIFLTSYLYKKKGGNDDDIFTSAWFIVPLGVIGARIVHVMNEWNAWYSTQPFVDVFKVWEGGLAIMGGVIGGALGVLIYCLIFKKSFFKLTDCIVPAVAVAHAIGRWGNFFNQEIYGAPVKHSFWPFAVFIEKTGQWHLGLFFIEGLCNLIIASLCIFVLLKLAKKHTGIVVGIYIFMYGVLRFFVEPLRYTDGSVGGQAGWIWLAFSFMIIGLVILVLRVLPLAKEKFNASDVKHKRTSDNSAIEPLEKPKENAKN